MKSGTHTNTLHTATSGYNHADGGGPGSLHEVQEQRAQQVSDWLQLLDGGDPHGHWSVLRLLLRPEVKDNNQRIMASYELILERTHEHVNSLVGFDDCFGPVASCHQHIHGVSRHSTYATIFHDFCRRREENPTLRIFTVVLFFFFLAKLLSLTHSHLRFC